MNSNVPDLLLFQMYPQRFSHQFPYPFTNFYDLIQKDMLAGFFMNFWKFPWGGSGESKETCNNFVVLKCMKFLPVFWGTGD